MVNILDMTEKHLSNRKMAYDIKVCRTINDDKHIHSIIRPIKEPICIQYTNKGFFLPSFMGYHIRYTQRSDTLYLEGIEYEIRSYNEKHKYVKLWLDLYDDIVKIHFLTEEEKDIDRDSTPLKIAPYLKTEYLNPWPSYSIVSTDTLYALYSSTNELREIILPDTRYLYQYNNRNWEGDFIESEDMNMKSLFMKRDDSGRYRVLFHNRFLDTPRLLNTPYTHMMEKNRNGEISSYLLKFAINTSNEIEFISYIDSKKG